MPLVTVPHPDLLGSAKTYSTTALAIGITALPVQNTEGFNVGDYVILGIADFDEAAEVRKISGITPSLTLTTDALVLPHSNGCQITFVKYNEVKIYSSTTKTGTYSLLTTLNLEVNIPEGTRYDDTAGSTSTWYKTSYYNSTTAVESTQSDPISFSNGSDGYSQWMLYSMVKDILMLINDKKAKYVSIPEIKDKINIRQQMWWLSPYTKRANRTTRTYTTTQNQAYITLDANFDKLEDEYSVRFHHEVPANGAPSTALSNVAGNLSAGNYQYVVSFIISTGETPPGTPSKVLNVAIPGTAGQVSLSGIPTDSTKQATSRKLYRTQANGSTYTLLTTFSDNTTTTYTDNSSDASIAGNAAPITTNPPLNNVDENYDLVIVNGADYYENFGNNIGVVPVEALQMCSFHENGATKQLLLGPTPASSNRQLFVRGFIQPTDLVNDTDVTLCPVPRLLTLPIAIEILNAQDRPEKIPEYEKLYSALIPGEIEHGRKQAGSATMRFRKDYGHRRYVAQPDKNS
jgi:hypothetical protein